MCEKVIWQKMDNSFEDLPGLAVQKLAFGTKNWKSPLNRSGQLSETSRGLLWPPKATQVHLKVTWFFLKSGSCCKRMYDKMGAKYRTLYYNRTMGRETSGDIFYKFLEQHL